MKAFSVIIAHLDDSIELYYTLWDLFKELDDFDYEIIIVDNGSDEVYHLASIENYLKRISACHNVKLFKYNEFQGTVPPWQFGIEKAVGEYLIIIDSHVTVSSGYFKKQYEVLKNDKDIKVLYSASCFTDYGKDMSFNYRFEKDKLELNFLNLSQVSQEKLSEPLISQMGCVIVDREFFVKIGMFGKCFFKYGGYGAEELMLAFKVQMFGGKVVFNREVFFHHSILDKHSGKKLKLQNKMMAAYILDGEDYMLEVFDNRVKEINETLIGVEKSDLIKEIPILAQADRNLILTASVSYRELLKKYGQYS